MRAEAVLVGVCHCGGVWMEGRVGWRVVVVGVVGLIVWIEVSVMWWGFGRC